MCGELIVCEPIGARLVGRARFVFFARRDKGSLLLGTIDPSLFHAHTGIRCTTVRRGSRLAGPGNGVTGNVDTSFGGRRNWRAAGRGNRSFPHSRSGGVGSFSGRPLCFPVVSRKQPSLRHPVVVQPHRGSWLGVIACQDDPVLRLADLLQPRDEPLEIVDDLRMVGPQFCRNVGCKVEAA
jgi:hypothetical protein